MKKKIDKWDPKQRWKVQFSSVQSLSHVQLFVTSWTVACQASLSITNSLSLLKLMPIQSMILCNHLMLYHPLLLMLSIIPRIRVFTSELVLCIRWPKYWSFSFSISPSMNIHDWFPLGLISFQSKVLSRVFPNTTVQKHQFFSTQLSFGPILTSIQDYWKNHSFDWTK